MIREYRDEFRGVLPGAASDWVFPGSKADGGPRNQAAFATAISEITEARTGVRINPHLFRGVAGETILRRDPVAIDDVRAMLGHSSYTTGLVHYRRRNQAAAAERLSETIADERRKTRKAAALPPPLLAAAHRRRPR